MEEDVRSGALNFQTIYINHQISISFSPRVTTRRWHCTRRILFLFMFSSSSSPTKERRRLRELLGWKNNPTRRGHWNFPLCHYCHRIALRNAICCYAPADSSSSSQAEEKDCLCVMIPGARTNWYPRQSSPEEVARGRLTWKDFWRVFIFISLSDRLVGKS